MSDSQTAMRENIPVVLVVFNDQGLGNERAFQQAHYGGRLFAVDYRNPDFAALARAYGLSGEAVERTEDFAPAFEKACNELPALIMLDISMPVMDGFELVNTMRCEPEIAETEVIFYTATYRLEQADDLARACGVRLVIPKPSEPQRILELVEAVLRQRHLQCFHIGGHFKRHLAIDETLVHQVTKAHRKVLHPFPGRHADEIAQFVVSFF